VGDEPPSTSLVPLDMKRRDGAAVEEVEQNTYDFFFMKFSFILDDISFVDHKQNAYVS
jgi:hypothetical protein